MSKTVMVNFKLDPEVKRSMELICSDIGISMSTAFTIFAKKVVNERRIPFELSSPKPIDPVPFQPQTEEQLFSRIDRAVSEIGSEKCEELDNVVDELLAECDT